MLLTFLRLQLVDFPCCNTVKLTTIYQLSVHTELLPKAKVIDKPPS